MCGIVAYIGDKPALPILLNGLKRLEYRGYDSAGVSVISAASGKIETVKSVGKIRALESKINDKCDGGAKISLDGTIGISHTRWATHGEPSVANAHPQMSADGKIAVKIRFGFAQFIVARIKINGKSPRLRCCFT